MFLILCSHNLFLSPPPHGNGSADQPPFPNATLNVLAEVLGSALPRDIVRLAPPVHSLPELRDYSPPPPGRPGDGKWACAYRQHTLSLSGWFVSAESSRIPDISVLPPTLCSIGFAPGTLKRGRCALNSVKEVLWETF